MENSNRFSDNLARIREDNGLNDPVQVNESEKNKFQKRFENLKLVEIQNNPNKSISYADMSWGNTILNSLDKLPSDILPYYKDYLLGLKEIISHPINTIKNLSSIGAGIAKEASVKQMQFMQASTPFAKAEYKPNLYKEFTDKDKNIGMVMNIDKELYNIFGTEENFKKYIAENPMAVINHLAEIFIPLGKATGLKKLEKIASNVDPINLVASSVSPATKILSKLPESLHTKALKIADDIPTKKMEKMIDISIKNKLNITDKSIAKLQKQIGNLEEVKKGAIEAVTNSRSGIVPVDYIFKDLDPYVKNLMEVSSEGIEIKKISDKFRKAIIEANNQLGRTDLNPTQISNYKVRFNKELNDFYDKIAATTEAMPVRKEIKAVVDKTMKEYLEQIVPEFELNKFNRITKNIIKKQFPNAKVDGITLKQLNDIEGSLIELRNVIKDRVRDLKTGEILPFQVGQKASTLGRFGAVIGGTTAKVAGGDFLTGGAIGYGIGTVGGVALGLIDSSPKIKMALGNYLNKLKAAGIIVHPNAALIRMGLYEASKSNVIENNMAENKFNEIMIKY